MKDTEEEFVREIRSWFASTMLPCTVMETKRST